jgi:hypothetical protein
MRPRLRPVSLVLAALVLLTGASAFSASQGSLRLDLLEAHRTLTLNPKVAARLRDYFGRHPVGALPDDIEASVNAALPRDLRASCDQMIAAWGDIAQGSARLTVRTIGVSAGRAWLALRCASGLAMYKDSYDERLAMLEPAAGTLELFPLVPDAVNDSTLYHFEQGEAMRLAGAEAIAFRVHSTIDSPCCDGPTSISETRLVIFTTSARGTKQALSLRLGSRELDHDDEDGDREVTYHAEPSFERKSGNAVAVSAAFTRTETGKPAQSGVERYRWNPGTARFEPIK